MGKHPQYEADYHDLADSEEQEYRITNTYLDNQTRQFLFEQMQDEARQRNLAAYAAEQQQHAQAYQSMEAERLARAAQVKANGGRWLPLPGNRYIDPEGNIIYSSDLA